ncbi:MAG: hypothetical protein DYG89_11785 [Caldilinea sp. CFX5]|nr:hypothetical protein [Caldilinea sp. CFX5]
MQLLLPHEIAERLVKSLAKAGNREIGGILMGEHVAENVFRVTEVTIQWHSGSFATFFRSVQDFMEPLRNFFRLTNNNYTRFNYLGEWHSHPLFMAMPSVKDRQTMQDIVKDPMVGANFVVLLILKLNDTYQLEGSVTVFQSGVQELSGQLVRETI